MLFTDLAAFVVAPPPICPLLFGPSISSSNRLSSSCGFRDGAGALASSSIPANDCRVDCKALSKATLASTGSSAFVDGSEGVSASFDVACFSGSTSGRERHDECIRGFDGGCAAESVENVDPTKNEAFFCCSARHVYWKFVYERSPVGSP